MNNPRSWSYSSHWCVIILEVFPLVVANNVLWLRSSFLSVRLSLDPVLIAYGNSLSRATPSRKLVFNSFTTHDGLVSCGISFVVSSSSPIHSRRRASKNSFRFSLWTVGIYNHGQPDSRKNPLLQCSLDETITLEIVLFVCMN